MGALEQSASLFYHFVYPKIKNGLVNGTLHQVESTQDTTNTKLDMYSGIDYWTIDTERGETHGIASRVQSGDNNDWGSTTIRYRRESGVKTEYAKLKNAIETGALYPTYFIQSYVSLPETFNHRKFDYSKDSDKIHLLNSALANTKDLIEYKEKGTEFVDWYYQTVWKYGAAVFVVIPWKFFEEKYPLTVWNRRILDSIVRYGCESKCNRRDD